MPILAQTSSHSVFLLCRALPFYKRIVATVLRFRQHPRSPLILFLNENPFSLLSDTRFTLPDKLGDQPNDPKTDERGGDVEFGETATDADGDDGFDNEIPTELDYRVRSRDINRLVAELSGDALTSIPPPVLPGTRGRAASVDVGADGVCNGACENPGGGCGGDDGIGMGGNVQCEAYVLDSSDAMESLRPWKIIDDDYPLESSMKKSVGRQMRNDAAPASKTEAALRDYDYPCLLQEQVLQWRYGLRPGMTTFVNGKIVHSCSGKSANGVDEGGYGTRLKFPHFISVEKSFLLCRTGPPSSASTRSEDKNGMVKTEPEVRTVEREEDP
ncbi:hypothetical protein BYT27DRAFT_7254247 [Phlegmacium glaucopus]|nr:hypothetical protein BYT27DRAFT_7254247 [Phlegmacium glaucopus]